MPPTVVPVAIVVGGRSVSVPNAALGRRPTGRPLAPGSKALTGRVKVVDGTPPGDVAAPPADVPPADTPPGSKAEPPSAP